MNEISHKQARRWIQKASDAMLTDWEAGPLADHVAGCDACRRYQKEVEELQTSIRVSLQRRAALHVSRSPQKAGVKQPPQLVPKLRRTIQMKNIQTITYGFVGVLMLAVVLFVGINLGQQFIPTPGMSETAAPTQPPQMEEKVPVEPVDPVSIDFYFYSTSTREKNAMKALVSQFNQEHKNEIVVQASSAFPAIGSNEGYFKGMSDQFDCYVTQADPREAALTDVVLDLNAWMEAEGSAFQLDFDAAILDAFRYEGSLMALPLSIQPAIMVYNADRLAQHGLEAPSADWTFDEFLEWITSVTSVSGADKSYGFLLSSSSVSTSGLFYAGRGLQWLDLSGDFPVVNLNTLEMANTLSWINEMEQSGILFESPPEEDWWTTISSAVQSGQIGFWTTYAGREDDEFFDGKKSTFQKGIVPLPFTAKPNGPYDHSYSQGMYISRVSQNPQACWSWAKYLSEHAAMLAGVPARTSVAGSPAWESRVGAEKAAIYRLALANTLAENHNNLHAYLLWPVYDWLWQVNQNIKNGNDPMQEAALAQQKADTYLACMAPLDVSPLTRKQLSAQVQACAKQADPNY